MKKRLVLGIVLIAITLIILAGCGSGGNAPHVQTLTVTGTVSGTISSGVTKDPVVTLTVTGVRVVIYDFATGHQYGTATTDGGGSFSVGNIPVGADLLIVVAITDSSNIVHRFSRVIAHVTLDNASTLVDSISSAVSEIVGKLYRQGVDLDPNLVSNITSQVQGLGHGFRCIPGVDIATNYGDDIPTSNADLSPIQIQNIMDSAYMKGMEIVNHLRYSISELNFAKQNTFYRMWDGFRPASIAYRGMNDIGRRIPEVVFSQKLFHFAPGTYALEDIQAATAGSTEYFGSWVLTASTRTAKNIIRDLKLYVTHNKAGEYDLQIFEVIDSVEYHYGDANLTYAKISNSTLNSFTGQIIFTRDYATERSKAKKTGAPFEFDQSIATGSLTQTMNWDVNGNLISASFDFTGDTMISNANAVVYTSRGRFEANEGDGQVSFKFTGKNDGPVYAFEGSLLFTMVQNSLSPVPGIGRITADLTNFEYKGEDRSRCEIYPYSFSGKFDINITNAATVDWASLYDYGQTPDNYLLGSITLTGQYTSTGYSAGERFSSVISSTGYNAGTFNTEAYYDLNNSKKVNINISSSPTAPFTLSVTSTIGAQLNISRAVDKTFSGNVIVDGRTIGTVQNSTSECTINFIDANSVTIYSEL